MKVILSVPDEGYSKNMSCKLNLICSFYNYHLVNTSAGGSLVLMVSSAQLSVFWHRHGLLDIYCIS
jgi:hypothetical protein